MAVSSTGGPVQGSSSVASFILIMLARRLYGCTVFGKIARPFVGGCAASVSGAALMAAGVVSGPRARATSRRSLDGRTYHALGTTVRHRGVEYCKLCHKQAGALGSAGRTLRGRHGGIGVERARDPTAKTGDRSRHAIWLSIALLSLLTFTPGGSS
jgi:hypothetical protein